MLVADTSENSSERASCIFNTGVFFFPLLPLGLGFTRWEWFSSHVSCGERSCAALVALAERAAEVRALSPSVTLQKQLLALTWLPKIDPDRLPGALSFRGNGVLAPPSPWLSPQTALI